MVLLATAMNSCLSYTLASLFRGGLLCTINTYPKIRQLEWVSSLWAVCPSFAFAYLWAPQSNITTHNLTRRFPPFFRGHTLSITHLLTWVKMDFGPLHSPSSRCADCDNWLSKASAKKQSIHIIRSIDYNQPKFRLICNTISCPFKQNKATM